MVAELERKMDANYERIKKEVGSFEEKNLFDDKKSIDAFKILRPKSQMTFTDFLNVVNSEINRPKWQNNFYKKAKRITAF